MISGYQEHIWRLIEGMIPTMPVPLHPRDAEMSS